MGTPVSSGVTAPAMAFRVPFFQRGYALFLRDGRGRWIASGVRLLYDKNPPVFRTGGLRF